MSVKPNSEEHPARKPKEAAALWNQLSAVLESTACQFDIVQPILLKAEKYYVDVDPVLALFVHGILLKEAEADVGEWDAVRELLHGEFDVSVRLSTDFRARLHAQFAFAVKSGEL